MHEETNGKSVADIVLKQASSMVTGAHCVTAQIYLIIVPSNNPNMIICPLMNVQVIPTWLWPILSIVIETTIMVDHRPPLMLKLFLILWGT